MVKSARSVSLDVELWQEIEKYRRKKFLNNVSQAIEDLIKKGLEKEVEK